MANIVHFNDFSIVRGDVRVQVNFDRFSEQFKRAQFELDGDVMNSMEPFMPMVTGTFIANTRRESASLQGTGRVCAAAKPFGRFLYMGKTMVDPMTGSTWARKGATKVLVSQYGGKTRAKENLSYSRASAKPLWFDEAKRADGEKWIKHVKEVAGGGRR